MAFIALRCPSCGAEINLDQSREFGFCSYCGTKVIQEKQIIEHRGTVKIDGIATSSSLLQRGYMCLKDYKFDDAYTYFDRVLDENPTCSKAYWGMLCCEKFAADDKKLLQSDYPLEKYGNYRKAVEFASQDELTKYKNIANKLNDRLTEENNAYKKNFPKLIIASVLFAPLLFMTIIGIALGVSEDPFAFILAAVFGIPSVLLIRVLFKYGKAVRPAAKRKQRIRLNTPN